MFSLSNAYGDVSYVATTTARAVIREGSLLTSPLLFAFSLSYKSPWKSLPGQPDKSVRFSVGNIEGVQRKASFKVSFLKALNGPSLGVLIFYSFSLKYLLSLSAFRSLSKEL